MSKHAEEFAKNLKRILSHLGWSQAELARRLDIAPTMVNRWASGEHMPSMTTIYKLMDIMHIQFQDLISPQESSSTSRIPDEVKELLELFDPKDFEILMPTIRGIIALKELQANQKAQKLRKTKA